MKEKAEDLHSLVIDRIHEVASDTWWDFQDAIEDRKAEVKDEILAEMQDADVWESGLTGEEILELMGDDLEEMVDEAIYSEWDI